MATLNDLQQLIEQVDTAPDKCAHLFIVTRTKINNERVFGVYQPEINEDISDSFIDLFLQFMRKSLEKEPEIQYYDIDDITGQSLQFINTQEVSNSQNIVTPILNEGALDLIELNDDFIQGIWAYAVKVSYNQHNIIFFRKYSRNKVLKRNWKDAIIFRDGTFSKAEEPVFQIDDKIDSLYLNGEILIFQPNNFERIFDYEEKYEEAATNALQQLTQDLDFVDMDALQEFVDLDGAKKRKLACIMRNGAFQNMGFEEVSATIEHYELGIDIDTENQRIGINRGNATRFLKVLNDDYLMSEATRIRYETSSKRKHR
ncbi:Kiwa anti-phage protein KwaB-like domain-containing protein [Bacillus cereus group sp. BC251]|jgi:hypothetical protein|uniref:Kiwa anti-phage protein KwaB-like domain-containing protein n=1 Tax=Bacillus cereus group TaxID=86661 RepID=UPI000C32F195|nr:Kiwa anti-phage protein KwaB-like domain-containing protein [Bacillus sp. HBCD-sjtu]HDR4389406.1 DUF4868 domain-containing protein [Bacillus cereus]AUD24472.1 hypothetical protein CU648_19330 [Bacillus sp. HBCD-sjtu]HDR4393943.1 DUF4868 domain-containing protein [Bacillus cereus]HDR4598039.1 DUF4868 domain-containing protein [Bacillus cereus]HDR4600894.1 DUF4868 domain-containing protein [Bacillus cereus]